MLGDIVAATIVALMTVSAVPIAVLGPIAVALQAPGIGGASARGGEKPATALL